MYNISPLTPLPRSFPFFPPSFLFFPFLFTLLPEDGMANPDQHSDGALSSQMPMPETGWRGGLRTDSENEKTCLSAKEPCPSAKEPWIFAKMLYLSVKALHPSAKKLYVSEIQLSHDGALPSWTPLPDTKYSAVSLCKRALSFLKRAISLCNELYVSEIQLAAIVHCRREVGDWGRDPKKCTGRGWGMGSSTI